ncbi:putative intracellular protease/amidase [Paenibacillus shirakamiensis]|uniref:Intracellular protease/amidase n=1 Tax=Paenibacillus shirakamiensis TaxID=1265935 RepID=A0ABS4JKM0_9BACL|nr:type 1 glutamine amidotransferase domain-containing protein [Paenibacillus shirakamiensis]MBP2002257.1 putative intracellular protease/amidase [Paenibacillus shirakamiensis]
MGNVLVVVTNVSKYPDQARATGLWLGEAVHFVDEVEKAGHHVDYVSPSGGYTPIDPHSLEKDQMTELDWTYYQNSEFMNKLGTTLAAGDINPEDYDVIYFTGGHGVMWDFPDNQKLQNIAMKIHENGGIVSSVCHGAVGLLNIKNDAGQHLIANKKVTGFANSEEVAVGLDKVVPFLTEDALVKSGAQFVKGEDWASFAVVDGHLVTGQNPASGGKVAEEVITLLKSN